MRRWSLCIGMAVTMLAGPLAAQTGVPVDRTWDPVARDFNRRDGGEGGSPSGPSPHDRGPADPARTIDRELARKDLGSKERGTLLMMRAMSHLAAGDRLRADRDIDQALQADPTLKYDLVASRAHKMAAAGRTQPAIDLVEQALREQPGYAPLVTTRGQVRMMQGDYALALADFSQNAGSDDQARRLRAQAYYTAGNYREAVGDLDYLLRTHSRIADPIHLVLWRYANNVKLRRDARRLLVADLRGYGEPEGWPVPIARFLAGRITVGELEIAAETDGGARRGSGRCLASYFIAMDMVRQGNRPRARELLRLTQARCGVTDFANWAATAELKRL